MSNMAAILPLARHPEARAQRDAEASQATAASFEILRRLRGSGWRWTDV